MDIELVLDAQAAIGESVTWVDAENALYWVDIKAPALYRTTHGSWETQSWALPADIGAFALDGAGRALVALRTGLFWLDLASGATTLAQEAPFDPALLRFNEGACDSAGRFWVGVMTDPLNGAKSEQRGSLYRYTTATGLIAQPDRSDLFNGMGWNADETQFYLSHSYESRVFSFPYDKHNGTLGQRQSFAEIHRDGIPDGAAMDVDGGYWCAIHGGGSLQRYTRDGRLDQEIALPVSQPTMCCFAGPALDELYVSSAREKLNDSQLANEPHAGGLFRLRPGIAGLPKPWRVS